MKSPIIALKFGDPNREIPENTARLVSHVNKTSTLPDWHPWAWPVKTWQRLHIDFAGPFMGTLFLVIVDAHSKWPESI